MVPRRSYRNRADNDHARHTSNSHHAAISRRSHHGSRRLPTHSSRAHSVSTLGHSAHHYKPGIHHYRIHRYGRRSHDDHAYAYSGHYTGYRGYGYAAAFYPTFSSYSPRTIGSPTYLYDDGPCDDVGLGYRPANSTPARLPPVGQRPDDAFLKTLQLGDTAFQNGDYAQAGRHYIRAQLEGVYTGEATLAYALTHFALGNYDLAALALRRSLDQIPDAVSAPLDITYFYPDAAVLKAHLVALEQYLQQGQATGHGWLVLGYVRFGTGDPVGAVQAFENALQASPGDALARLLQEAAQAVRGQSPGPNDGGASMGPPARGAYLLASLPDLPR